MATSTERWLFLGFFFAFAVKCAAVAAAHLAAHAMQESTAPVAVLITAVVDKVGTFAMLRFCLQLFPEASKWATPVILVLAAHLAIVIRRARTPSRRGTSSAW
ncbi:hypothetical protein GCM10017687_37340 [Streptomyces echinatus]|uniref:proton-conducting transporter transmembrane domain-containing protein n=1 Tax=Streptomyces echinatus TaxID=67293 RepID=UPI0031F08175